MATDADSSKAEMKRNVWSEELSDFLEGIDSYKSTVPEAVIKYYLQKGGATIFDERIVKVVAIAADKFLAETLHETMELSKLKAQNPKRKAEPVDLLKMEDVEEVLSKQAIFTKKRK